MTNPIYRFYLRLGNAGVETLANPIYKDDLSIDYEQEAGQKFFRKKLNGKLTFLRKDYDKIMRAPFDTIYQIIIKKSDDRGHTWANYWHGKFMRTDCTIDVVDESVTVQPSVVDEYAEVLSGLDKEYNLIELAPAVENILFVKRPIIQVYKAGDKVVSCFLSGMNWEQDVKEPITDIGALENQHHFTKSWIKLVVEIKEGNQQEYLGTYVNQTSKTTGETTIYTCVREDNPAYKLEIENTRTGNNTYRGYIRIYKDGVLTFRSEIYSNLENNATHHVSGVPKPDQPSYDYLKVSISSTSIFSRLLLDKSDIVGKNAYRIDGNDLVEDNRNYHYAIGYKMGNIVVSNRSSTKPTEYGRRDDGTYFAPPLMLGVEKFYPVAQSTWVNTSFWFMFNPLDEVVEEDGRASFVLKDAYELGSCINVLLKKISNITFDSSEECSKFLYSKKNPITSIDQRLYFTQKSNLLTSEYQEPAKKAMCTLQTILNMLRDTCRCYWYIEDGKMHIEHISFFNNGGTYSGQPVIGYDLTKMLNSRSEKPWSFGRGEFTFDKVEMAERYQFKWMDDCTLPFNGYPIEIKSNYVQKGKVEEINVGNFTSDVDLILLNSKNISKDGFVIMSAIPASAAFLEKGNPFFNFHTGSGQLDKRWNFKKNVGGHRVKFGIYARAHTENGVKQEARNVLFRIYYENDWWTSDPVPVSDEYQEVYINVPKGAFAFSFYINGWADISVVRAEVTDGLRELPFYTARLDEVTYSLQNGYMSCAYLQPNFYTSDLPASNVEINKAQYFGAKVDRKKKQTISFPAGPNDPNPRKLVKTLLGLGQIEKISVNLCSRFVKTTLKYDTEQ